MDTRNEKMVSLDGAVIARLKTHGETFELYVDPDLALKYREGENVDLNNLLAVQTVFKNVSTGEKASQQAMEKIFETTDIKTITDKILKKGEIHLTTEQRKKKAEEKRRQIVTIITRNAINPQTGKPHPAARIEKALEEAKVNINMTKSVEEQIESVLKAIKPIIPIKFTTVTYAVRIPAQYAGSCYGQFREYGEIKKEDWDKNGNLLFLIEMPAGLQDEFYSRLNGLTHGEVQTKIIR